MLTLCKFHEDQTVRLAELRTLPAGLGAWALGRRYLCSPGRRELGQGLDWSLRVDLGPCPNKVTGGKSKTPSWKEGVLEKPVALGQSGAAVMSFSLELLGRDNLFDSGSFVHGSLLLAGIGLEPI